MEQKTGNQPNMADEKMVNDAFQHLLDTYLASPRLSTSRAKPTKAYVVCLESPISCTPSPWHR